MKFKVADYVDSARSRSHVTEVEIVFRADSRGACVGVAAWREEDGSLSQHEFNLWPHAGPAMLCVELPGGASLEVWEEDRVSSKDCPACDEDQDDERGRVGGDR